MQFWTEMMLRVIPVIKPKGIVDLFVRTDTPGDRLVRITAIMQEIPVQVRQTMPKVIEWQEEQDKLPVQDAHKNKEADECGNFEYAPIRIRSALTFDFSKDRFGIIPQIAQKDVAPDILRLALLAMPVDGQPIDGLSMLVRFIAIAHVMAMM